MLARLTHAPGLVWLAGAAGLDPRPAKVAASTLESQLWADSAMYIEQYGDFWTYAQNGRWLQKFCGGAAQLDQYGNANNSVIGSDYHRPKVRLPGTAGLGDMGSIGKTVYYWYPDHNPRALVEKVDFISCAGYLGGGDERERLGLTGGPELVITNLAVLDFDPTSKRMRVKSVHPGDDGRTGAGGYGLRARAADRRGARHPGAQCRTGTTHSRGHRPRRDAQARVQPALNRSLNKGKRDSWISNSGCQARSCRPSKGRSRTRCVTKRTASTRCGGPITSWAGSRTRCGPRT